MTEERKSSKEQLLSHAAPWQGCSSLRPEPGREGYVVYLYPLILRMRKLCPSPLLMHLPRQPPGPPSGRSDRVGLLG